MNNIPSCYPKCKWGFPWLLNVWENGKEMALVLCEVIMEDLDDSFGSGLEGEGFYLVFYV